MRADQVRVVDVGIVQIALGLHLRLHCLHHFAFTEQLVIDLDAGDFLEGFGQCFGFVFMGRNGFREHVDFHARERFGGVDKPFHLLHLIRLRKRRRLELVIYPLLCLVFPGKGGC